MLYQSLPHRLPLHFMLTLVHYAQTDYNAHLKKRTALKVWVWSRGLPATLQQIPTSFLSPLVGETHGTSGQCVSFSLIDVGSVLLPASFFFSSRFSFSTTGSTWQWDKWLIIRVGQARTIYIRFTYGIFGAEITKYTVIYGVYIRFWPTLLIMCLGGYDGSITFASWDGGGLFTGSKSDMRVITLRHFINRSSSVTHWTQQLSKAEGSKKVMQQKLTLSPGSINMERLAPCLP